VTGPHPTGSMDQPTTGTESHPLAEAGQQATESAGHLAERAADIGIQQADRGREMAADGIDKLARTVRRVSTDMQTDQPQVANAALSAADQAEKLAQYLRETDARQIISNVEDTARRQPLLFIGGAFLLGLAASRLVKAATPDTAQAGQFERSGYSTGYRGSDSYQAAGPGSGNGHEVS
jgi:hypothetical protein